ncbi:MAG: hypothetical protein JNJ58_04020 [Chitinophagaceae bacterium]|nr:hypothetical protein [Chitinophagaceae bacterium]
MKQGLSLLLITAILLTAFVLMQGPSKSSLDRYQGYKPAEAYFLSMQYPYLGEGLNEYKKAVVKELARIKKYRAINTPWQQEGPHNIGGRINCIAVHPTLTNNYLVGCADGGIFKTTDGGSTWTPIFDNAYALSVSQIVYEPGNANTIYAGTGDQVLGGYSHMGNGIYKSTNGGSSWVNSGLTNVGTISKIIVDPLNVNTVYAATTGNPFISDSNRGVYKSIDGGATWNRVLFLGLNAGIGDMVMNVNTPSIIYATGRKRFRSNQSSIITGTEARIFRSQNGGLTWDTLTNGLPTGAQCRIGMCISTNNPDLLYANYVDTTLDFGGLYKTTNGGNSWTLVSSSTNVNLGGFGWYFGQIRMDPNNDNTLFILGVGLYKSTNGGTSFNSSGNTHSDKHDLKFLSSSQILLATDGGFYKTSNGGNSWTLSNNLPIMQFYRIAYNPWDSLNYYGGAQDNGTNYGSLNAGLSNWIHYYGADGFKPQFNPNDDMTFYVEWQNGNVEATDDGGMNYNSITNSLTATDRCSWNTPYFVSQYNPDHLYIGTYQVYKNTSGPVDSWSPISGDLTDGINTSFHVITALDQSPVNQQVLYAGTSDANVWVTQNDGGTWTQINGALPDRYVSSVKPSPDSVSCVFVSHSGYRNNDSLPHIYYSQNYGNTWTSIAGNLPNFAINDIWVKKGKHDSCIIVATDGGVYATENRGFNWERVGSNMPIIPVYDIEYNPATKRIFAGTFARSMQTMEVDSIFKPKEQSTVGINETLSANAIRLYPNPCKDYFMIQGKMEENDLVILLDAFGRRIRTWKAGNSQNQYSTRGIAEGNYILLISSGQKSYNRVLTVAGQ